MFCSLAGLSSGPYINSHTYIRELTKGRYVSYIRYNYGFYMELYTIIMSVSQSHICDYTHIM